LRAQGPEAETLPGQDVGKAQLAMRETRRGKNSLTCLILLFLITAGCNSPKSNDLIPFCLSMEYEQVLFPRADSPLVDCRRCQVCSDQGLMTCVSWDSPVCSAQSSGDTLRWRYHVTDTTLEIGRYVFRKEPNTYLIENGSVQVTRTPSLTDSMDVETFMFDWEHSTRPGNQIENVTVDLARGIIISVQSRERNTRLIRLTRSDV
jgi:hypothetical protein